MHLKSLTNFLTVATLFWASVAHSQPMYIDTSATGNTTAAGDLSLELPTPIRDLLQIDSNPNTALFESMQFAIDPSDNLTTIDEGTISGLTLGNQTLNTFGENEFIGTGYGGIGLMVSWDNNTSILGDISFYFIDANDSNLGFDTQVASGKITSLSETLLQAELDQLFSGFWLDQYGNEITANIDEPFKIAMSVQAGGSSVDIQAVPEPSILALFSIGLLSLGFKRHQKNIKA